MLFASALGVRAADFSFTGNLANANDVRLFEFTLGAPATVTLSTVSFSGGTNAGGSVILGGGFDPVLSLFGPGGSFITLSDDINTSTGNFDALIQQSLLPGVYTLALTQATSFPLGSTLAEGFTGSGLQDFGDGTSAYAVDIRNVTSATAVSSPRVPDASSPLAALGISLIMLALGRGRFNPGFER
jgi:hypothetical protein